MSARLACKVDFAGCNLPRKRRDVTVTEMGGPVESVSSG